MSKQTEGSRELAERRQLHGTECQCLVCQPLDQPVTGSASPSASEQQRRSFAYGNAKIENDDITMEIINEEADRMAKHRKQSAFQQELAEKIEETALRPEGAIADSRRSIVIDSIAAVLAAEQVVDGATLPSSIMESIARNAELRRKLADLWTKMAEARVIAARMVGESMDSDQYEALALEIDAALRSTGDSNA